jgi:hypothetical protein
MPYFQKDFFFFFHLHCIFNFYLFYFIPFLNSKSIKDNNISINLFDSREIMQMKMGKYVDYKQICVVEIIKCGLICNKRNETLFIAKNPFLCCCVLPH